MRFAWTVDGVETTVEFTLTENEPEHEERRHAAHAEPERRPAELRRDPGRHGGARGELQTFWSLAIANLSDYLSGRELTPKCDYTSAELRASVVIDAAPEAVFDSLTQPEHFRNWFGAHVDIEPYVGGRFAMGGFEQDPGGIKFVEFEPGRKATLRFADGQTDSWELAGSDGKTRLTLMSSGFDPNNPPYSGWAGWLTGVAALRGYHELPALAHDLASDRGPGRPGRDVQHRRLAGLLLASSFPRRAPVHKNRGASRCSRRQGSNPRLDDTVTNARPSDALISLRPAPIRCGARAPQSPLVHREVGPPCPDSVAASPYARVAWGSWIRGWSGRWSWGAGRGHPGAAADGGLTACWWMRWYGGTAGESS